MAHRVAGVGAGADFVRVAGTVAVGVGHVWVGAMLELLAVDEAVASGSGVASDPLPGIGPWPASRVWLMPSSSVSVAAETSSMRMASLSRFTGRPSRRCVDGAHPSAYNDRETGCAARAVGIGPETAR